MAEIGKSGWLAEVSGRTEEELLQETMVKEAGPIPIKTVMVYWMNQENLRKEPLGILMERRKLERDRNNEIGMLRLARKLFANTEEEAKRILIGDYV